MRRGKHLRSDALAAEWRALREIACKYRFGRIELMPIRKTGEALARYLAGYLSKSFQRFPSGCKHRLVRLSRGMSRQFNMTFSINNLANLIYRTRLKIAAGMLHFEEYGDFADYFEPRWNYYLGDLIAAIPVPLKFKKVEFERGWAASLLDDYAENPGPYLNEEIDQQLVRVERALLRNFTELAFGELREIRQEEARPTEADNIDVGPLTEADLQADLLAASDDPF